MNVPKALAAVYTSSEAAKRETRARQKAERRNDHLHQVLLFLQHLLLEYRRRGLEHTGNENGIAAAAAKKRNLSQIKQAQLQNSSPLFPFLFSPLRIVTDRQRQKRRKKIVAQQQGAPLEAHPSSTFPRAGFSPISKRKAALFE